MRRKRATLDWNEHNQQSKGMCMCVCMCVCVCVCIRECNALGLIQNTDQRIDSEMLPDPPLVREAATPQPSCMFLII
jgi:hypothetical protein